MSSFRGTPLKNYQNIFKSSISMFVGGKVLITNHLHASILAFLLHKPHVYVDQSYRKIRRSRGVTFEVSEKFRNWEEMKFDEVESFGMSGRHCSRWPLSGRLATTLVDRFFHHYFPFFPFFFSFLRRDLFS